MHELRAKIHRGAEEIGGSCVELEAEGAHLLIDVGRPLSDDLSEQAAPPAIRGFTASPDPQLIGAVISHGHPDHYGLAFQLDGRVPIYIGRAASRILNAAAFFMGGSTEELEPECFLEDLTPLELGPFTITPYLVDHSAFDSYALLVEAGSRRLFYTGDLRAHGRKPGTFERLLRQPPSCHAMLMEGTRLSRGDESGQPSSETEVEAALAGLFHSTEGMVLALYSPQNVDRYVSTYKAARRSGRELIVDLYAATIAEATGRETIPQADWDGVRVFVPWTQKVAVKRARAFERVNALSSERIYPEELAEIADRVVMSFRPSMSRDLVDAGCLEGAAAVWSMWPGYLRESRNTRLSDFLEEMLVPLSVIHCSGHATVADLQRLAAGVSPERLVPIHTAEPGRYSDLFANVELHPDGEWWSV